MGLLIALALVLGACYAPDVRDCMLACAADTDCVQDQVCTADHWCAAPGLAGGCGDPAPDAGVDAARDVHPDSDGVPMIELHIHIDGPGTVVITGGPTCDAVDCTYPIAKDVPAVLTAVPKDNHPFDHWTSVICMNQPAACTFTPIATSMVGVRFH